MSLELSTCTVGEELCSPEIIKKIIAGIEKYDYKNIYLCDYRNYGFVKKEDEYISNSPPLFELIFNENSINLSVYGDLNDLANIKEQIENIFDSNHIKINLQEI